MTDDGRPMRERVLAGDPSIAEDPQLAADPSRARTLTRRYDTTDPTDGAARREVLTRLLAVFGAGSEIRAPFPCDDVGTPARVVRPFR